MHGASVYSAIIGCTDGMASVYPVQLFFLVFCLIDLELISSSSFCSSKCFLDFLEQSWTEFEQVCKISKANSIWIKLLTQEPLLIIQSRIKSYKIST